MEELFMIIRVNDRDIIVNSVLSDSMKKNNKSFPALRFEFSDQITSEDVEALASGSFEILDDEGNLLGTHEGYTIKGSLSFTVGKITTADERILELEDELSASRAANAELQDAINIIG